MFPVIKNISFKTYGYVHGLSSYLLRWGYTSYPLLTAQTREAKYRECIIAMALFTFWKKF